MSKNQKQPEDAMREGSHDFRTDGSRIAEIKREIVNASKKGDVVAVARYKAELSRAKEEK